MRRRVRIEELLDASTRQALGPSPSPARLRSTLPRGWVPNADGIHAERDSRLFFREGWILILCLVVFGSLGGMFLLGALPRGWSGVGRLGILVGLVALAAGIAGPLITRALRRS